MTMNYITACVLMMLLNSADQSQGSTFTPQTRAFKSSTLLNELFFKRNQPPVNDKSTENILPPNSNDNLTQIHGNDSLVKFPVTEERSNGSHINRNSSSALTTQIPIKNAKNVTTTNQVPAKSITWTLLLCLFVVCLFTVGVAGNILTIITIVKSKTLQNIQNYLVFNLAISDLFTLVIVLPLIMIIWHMPWPFGRFACKYVLPICDILPPVSILTLVAISIDRLRAIAYALSRSLSLKFGVVCIVAIWSVCYLIVGLPMSFVIQLDQNKRCGPVFTDARWRKSSYTLRAILLYIFPSTVIFACYVRVNRVLRRSMDFFRRSVSGKSKIFGLRRQKRVTTMFFAIFFAFVVCYLPLNVYIILMSYVQDQKTLVLLHTYLSQTAIIFGLANSACSPIILYLLSTTYCKSFQTILPFLTYFCRKNDEANNNRRETLVSSISVRSQQSTKTEMVANRNDSLFRDATPYQPLEDANEANLLLETAATEETSCL